MNRIVLVLWEMNKPKTVSEEPTPEYYKAGSALDTVRAGLL